MLGEAYDSQVEHFLRGDVSVDGEAIRHEAMIVHGKARMYFGPLPAVLRIPLNFVYPAGRGRWSRISVFSAVVIALCAFAALIRDALAKSVVKPIVRERFGIVCLVAFAFASPLLLLLGEASIYNGIFRLMRVPYAFSDYFALRPPSLQAEAPFFHAERHAYGVTGTRALTSVPTSEAYFCDSGLFRHRTEIRGGLLSVPCCWIRGVSQA